MSSLPSEWRQGSILHFEDREWIILTQCCDIHHDSLEMEPRIELMELSRETKAPDKRYYRGRHPRMLHLGDGNDSRIVLTSKSSRIFVAKEKLRDQSDCVGRVTPSVLQHLRFWIGQRYMRRAFADEFNHRFTDVNKAIYKKLKSIDPDDIEFLYFIEPNEDELSLEKSPDDFYEVELLIILRADVHQDIMHNLEGFAQEIDDLARKNAIDLDSRVVNISGVGLQESLNAIAWSQYDWLSTQENSEA